MTPDSIAWAIGGIIIGSVVTYVVSWWFARRTTVRYEVSAVPLVATVPKGSPELVVSWGGHVLTDPHLVSLSMENRGPSDVGGDKLRTGRTGVRVEGDYVAALTLEGLRIEADDSRDPAALIEPDLLKAGGKLRAELLFNGAPGTADPIDGIENVRLVQAKPEPPTTLSLKIVLLVLVGIAIASVFGGVDEPLVLRLITGVVSLGVGGATLLVLLRATRRLDS